MNDLDLSLQTEETEEFLEEKIPEYGGEHGRIYEEDTLVGTEEYISELEPLRVYHNGKPEFEEETEEEIPVSLDFKFEFEDPEGEPLPARDESGSLWLRMIPVDSIIFPGTSDNQLRKGSLNTRDLETSIDQIGLLEPIHVVPFGSPVGFEKDDEGNDIESLPLYHKYVLLHGRRRFEATINLGSELILAFVDTTVPYSLIKLYQTLAHTGTPYKFSEKMAYVKYARQEQPTISNDFIENALGFKTGELAKADYIEQVKVDFPDIYTKVEQDKVTIDQGFKLIEKEEKKREKEENEPEEDTEKGDDQDLQEVELEVKHQEIGDRKILDAPTRRAVESRAGAKCEVCGYGDGMPSLASIFSVHHMVPVQYGGSDSTENLILLCQNCHKLAHEYEVGRLPLSKEDLEKNLYLKKVVVLGNMMRKVRGEAIKAVKEHDKPLARQLDKGTITIGRALQKSGIKLNAEDSLFEGTPYEAYYNTTRSINFGGNAKGELGQLDGEEIVDTETPDEEITLDDLLIDVENVK